MGGFYSIWCHDRSASIYHDRKFNIIGSWQLEALMNLIGFPVWLGSMAHIEVEVPWNTSVPCLFLCYSGISHTYLQASYQYIQLHAYICMQSPSAMTSLGYIGWRALLLLCMPMALLPQVDSQEVCIYQGAVKIFWPSSGTTIYVSQIDFLCSMVLLLLSQIFLLDSGGARRHDWFYYTSTKCAIPDDMGC